MDDLHFLAVEAGADVAGPFQFAVVVDAQGEGAVGLALAFDHAAEDELGGGGELELYPVGGAAGFGKNGGGPCGYSLRAPGAWRLPGARLRRRGSVRNSESLHWVEGFLSTDACARSRVRREGRGH